MSLGGRFYYEIDQYPEPEDAGKIRLNAIISDRDDNLTFTFTTLSPADEFINDDRDECQSKIDLNNFLKEAGIDNYDIAHMMYYLMPYVAEITSSTSIGYSPGCALEVLLDLFPCDEPHIEEPVQTEEAVPSQVDEAVQVRLNETVEEEVLGLEDEDHDVIFDFDHQAEEAAPSQLREVFRVSLNETTEEEVQVLEDELDLSIVFEELGPSQLGVVGPVDEVQHLLDDHERHEHDVIFDFDLHIEEAARSQIEEVIRVSFNETDTVGLRPASKLAVGSLKRKIYKKTSDVDVVGETVMCTICLEEFNDGRSIVTLPCGHEFDDACILEWFVRNHFCPLCRFELPCER